MAGIRLFTAFLAGAAIAAMAVGVAAAKEVKAAVSLGSPHDGQWVIDATTSSFFCPLKRKRLVATVQGGNIVKVSGLPGSVAGGIGPGGDVTIHIRIYGVTAKARGRVNGVTGAGDWSANSLICGQGRWSATAAR